MRLIQRLIFAFALLALGGCSTIRYVAQAAGGQWELAGAARPIPEVIADPATPELTRKLLSDVEDVRHFAWKNGLRVDGNYEKYVELDREYPIWFVNASHPLAFRARVFSFPIVGSFPGLAWFDKRDAEAFRDSLAKQGLDVNMRGVSAFSTGGWFDDPIVWSMLSNAPGAFASLVNTVLHESLHATVLIKDQQYYNESLAAFVGDTMAAHYLQQRSGQEMPAELRAYLEGKRLGSQRAQRLNEAYKALDAVYTSDLPDPAKYEKKGQIIDELVRDMRLSKRPNNATLIGFRLYQVARDDFSELFAACGHSWRRFLTAAASLEPEDFGAPQLADFGPVVAALRQRGCPTEVRPLAPFSTPERRWRSKQRRRIEAIRSSLQTAERAACRARRGAGC